MNTNRYIAALACLLTVPLALSAVMGQDGDSEDLFRGRLLVVSDADSKTVLTTSEALQSLKLAGYTIDDLFIEQDTKVEDVFGQLQELANDSGPEDRLVVMILGRGTKVESGDAIELLGKNFSLQQVLDTFSTSACQHQILMFDASWGGQDSKRFKPDSLSVRETQTCIVNTLSDPENKHSFLKSLSDGFTLFGDANSNGQISCGELFDYVYRWHEFNELAQPLWFGSLSGASIGRAVDLDELGQMKTEARLALARAELQSAYQSLLVERDVLGCKESLVRALNLKPSESITRELRQLSTSSDIDSNETLMSALNKSSGNDEKLLVLLKDYKSVFPIVIQCSGFDAGSKMVSVSAAYRVNMKDFQIVFSKIVFSPTISIGEVESRLFLKDEQLDEPELATRLAEVAKPLVEN